MLARAKVSLNFQFNKVSYIILAPTPHNHIIRIETEFKFPAEDDTCLIKFIAKQAILILFLSSYNEQPMAQYVFEFPLRLEHLLQYMP